MLKLILFIGMVYAFFKVRKFMKQISGTVNRTISEMENKTGSKMSDNAVDDVMVKDPVCEIYFPKREGLHLHDKGQDFYFCSTECRDAFVTGKKNV
jgi:YHS domain-containing protein